MSSNSRILKVSLADYYPPDTTMFYGYPSGEASGFYNTVPPWVEELVSARPSVAIRTTDQMRTVVFERPAQLDTRRFLRDTLGYNLANDNQLIVLPKEIDEKLVDSERNNAVAKALMKLVPTEKLNMAQPLRGNSIDRLYQIDPELTTFLNDKGNLPQWVDQKYLPQRYAQFPNGTAFAACKRNFSSSSCVVKVAASSAGDGVVICKKSACDGNSLFDQAREKFRDIKGPVFVEEYVESDDGNGYGVQFAIPFDTEQPIKILGFGRQLITRTGEFLGSFIDVNVKLPANIQSILLSEILPKVRQMGCFGIGGVDIIVRKNGDLCVIDPNFRLTAVSAPLIQAVNSGSDQKVIPFTAYIDASRTCFRTLLKEFATEGTSVQILRLAALAEGEERQNFNGTLLYRDKQELKEIARALVQSRVRSLALDILSI